MCDIIQTGSCRGGAGVLRQQRQDPSMLKETTINTDNLEQMISVDDESSAGPQCYCADCSPEGYHAIRCEDNNCVICSERKPGVQLWHSHQLSEGEDPYTKNDPVMAQTYVEDRNLVTVLPNASFMTDMAAVANGGRHYRIFDERMRTEVAALEQKLASHGFGRLVSSDRLKKLELKKAEAGYGPDDELEPELRAENDIFERERYSRTTMKARLETVLDKFRAVHQQCMPYFIQMSNRVDKLLTECGILPHEESEEVHLFNTGLELQTLALPILLNLPPQPEEVYVD